MGRPLYTPLTPGGQKVIFFFFSESSHVACQIKKNEAKNTMQANILPFYTPMINTVFKRTYIILKSFTYRELSRPKMVVIFGDLCLYHFSVYNTWNFAASGTKVVTKTRRSSSPAGVKKNLEARRLSTFPGGKPPAPKEVAKIEREDWPGPPSPAALLPEICK